MNESKLNNGVVSDFVSDMGADASINREYNSNVFKMFFSDKKNAVELYNALNGTSHTEDELTINTLDNAVFLKIYNDVSFVISGTVNLYEHQSTVNPNMPLRDLFYITDMYRTYAMQEDLYGSRLIRIPTPKFVVFYNGVRSVPDDEVLRLSEAFERQTDEPELELAVRMLNINYGHNKELMDKCVALRDFAILNYRIREELAKGKVIEKAVAEAVDSCIDDDIMAEFLKKEKGGVIRMHVLDYNEEKHRESLIQEGIEKGISQGIAEGISEKTMIVIKNMLLRGQTDEDIIAIAECTQEQIDSVRREIG